MQNGVCCHAIDELGLELLGTTLGLQSNRGLALLLSSRIQSTRPSTINLRLGEYLTGTGHLASSRAMVIKPILAEEISEYP